MTVTSKVRLYDLAKELKQDTKRLIEEVRREGVDVSVPSNSISKELADKIRNRYFPKKEASAPRTVKVVKRARPIAEEAPAIEDEAVEPLPQPIVAEEAAEQPAPVEQPGAPRPPVVVRQVRKLTPAARAEHPAAAAAAGATAPVQEPVQEAETIVPETAELSSMPEMAAPAPPAPPVEETLEATPDVIPERIAPPPPAPSRQVRVLRPTAAALNAGVKVGERAPAPVVVPQPAPVSPRERRERQERNERGSERTERNDRNSRTPVARAERAGTPGETATPQITYIPSPSDGRGRRPGRGGRNTTRGGKSHEGGRGGRFDRDYIPPPKALSLEDRIAGRLSTTDVATLPGELKPVRIVEGSTVKEFAE